MAWFMKLASILVLVVIMIMGFISTSSAYTFYVGGRDGWVQNPKEKYNSWAQRMRFQINDKLVFRYEKGKDSVVVVKKEDYDACNAQNPIQKLEGGDSVFVFNRSGPFYFISGDPTRCAGGEKLIVVVMADRTKKNSPPPLSPPPAPSPSSASPSPAPSSPSVSPAPSPSSASPSPAPSSPPVSPAPSSPGVSPGPSPAASTVPPPAEAPGGGASEPVTSPPAQSTPPPGKSASVAGPRGVTMGGIAALVLAHAFLG